MLKQITPRRWCREDPCDVKDVVEDKCLHVVKEEVETNTKKAVRTINLLKEDYSWT